MTAGIPGSKFNQVNSPEPYRYGKRGWYDKAGLLICVLILGLLLSGCAGSDEPTATIAGLTATPSEFRGSIFIGGIFDLKGPTSAEGREYANGALDYIRYFNNKGGAVGYQLEVRIVDYAGKNPDAIEAYQELVKNKTVAFLGWTHSDTLAITNQLQDGKTPFFSASYRDDFVRDTRRNPYNFMVTPSYSDQMRMLVQFLRVNHPEPIRRLGVAHLLTDSDFGRYPLQTGRVYAANNNIFWYHEGFLTPMPDPKNLKYEIGRLKAARPDWTVINCEPDLTGLAMREIKQVAVDGRFAGMPLSGGPDFLRTAGQAAEGFYVGVTLPYATDESAGMSVLKQNWLKYRRSEFLTTYEAVVPEQPSSRYIQGWITAKVLAEGIRRAAITATGRGQTPSAISGDDIKAALETLENYTADNMLPPLTYNINNHKGTQMRFYRVEGGKWQTVMGNSSLAELEKMDYVKKLTPTPALPTPSPTKR
jgi:branched-chain amino acid transport system substrate-binding protein